MKKLPPGCAWGYKPDGAEFVMSEFEDDIMKNGSLLCKYEKEKSDCHEGRLRNDKRK